MPHICLQLSNRWHMLQNHNDFVPENPKILHKCQLQHWRLLSTSIHDTGHNITIIKTTQFLHYVPFTE